MFIPVGLALGALSTVSSLVESAASSLAKAGGNDPLTALAQAFTGEQPPSNPASVPAASQFDKGTLAALISLQGQGTTGASGASGASGLFAKLDADGDGTVSKSEFESTLGKAGVDTNSADTLFSKLDANGDGSISKSELASARHAYQSHRHHHTGGAGQGGGASSLLNATNADGSTTQTTANADGSSTTTISYPDGSTVTSTTPAAAQSGGTSGGSGSSSSGNLIEKLIQMQSMLISQSTPTTAAVA
jgi:hypothetical protein